MPWTIAHAAAVVPLHRWSRGRLSFAGLAAGSFAPDIPYYALYFDFGTFAHSPAGTVFACVPLALTLLLVLHALRAPVDFVLPQPFRAGWGALLGEAPHPLALVLSIVLGAWTHIAWDACTHATGWVVRQLPLLQQPIPGTPVGVYHGLQELSTVGGTVVLVLAYRSWLRRSNAPAPSAGDAWRWIALAACLGSAAVFATFLAAADASAFQGAVAARVFLFRGALYGTVAFALLYAAFAIAARSHARR